MNIIAILFLILLFLVASFIFFVIIILPLAFTMFSIITFFTVPLQLWKLFKNRRVRQNHALEHATINLLEETIPDQKIAGLSLEDGFFVFAPVNPVVIEKAARKGLQLLKGGQSNLAIHAECGTSSGVVAFIASLFFLGLFISYGRISFLLLPIILGAAWAAGRYLGPITQRFLTTSTRLENVEILGIEMRIPPSLPVALFLGPQTFVKTGQPLEVEKVLVGELIS
jgi:hypothetical protein